MLIDPKLKDLLQFLDAQTLLLPGALNNLDIPMFEKYNDYASLTLDQIKDAVKAKVAEKTKPVLDATGYDVTKMEYMTLGRMLDVALQLENEMARNIVINNVKIFKELGLGEHIYEKKYQSIIVMDVTLKDKYQALVDAEISKEDIVNNWLDKLLDPFVTIEALKVEIAKLKSVKPKTPEEEKAELVAKFEGLGIPKLKDCLLADLKMLAEANEDLVKKNAEYIKTHLKHTDYTVSSICVYLTCVDFDKKWEYLNSSVKINLPVIIKDTKNMTFEEFK